MTDEEKIIQLFEDGDRAMMTADEDEMRRIYADDYIQCDESGTLSTRQDVIDSLRSGKVRFVSMRSMGRRIRLLQNDVAIVHGSEQDVIVRHEQQTSECYVYMDVVMQREGRWQIVASQLARPG